ncbi:MAG: hydantoinase/oxoprolinase family protein, partial [Bacteroidota bacterium]
MWNIWIDTGGTFTDCIALTPGKERKRLKILSSSVLRGTVESFEGNQVKASFSWPAQHDIFKGFYFRLLKHEFNAEVVSVDLQTGVIRLSKDLPNEVFKGDFEITSLEEVPILAARLLTSTPLSKSLPALYMRLGSTKGTNALLEKKGSSVAFITTKGFKDLLMIRDQQRPDLFSLNIETPDPLFSYSIEINERINAKGEVELPIDVNHLPEELLALPPDTAIAICFLNSYRNTTHEKLLKDVLTRNGFSSISCSSELSNNIKLVQRADTTVANAYLEPIISKYITGISSKIDSGKLWIMTSSGSIVDSKNFSPKDSLLSGPAGGVVGAVNAGKRSGFSRIITFDMGGTSTDVAIYNGKYEYQFETNVGQASIQSPCLHIETIAAGGGSICEFKNGLLQVGPESAGAEPGPACYGAGGPLTITDVNLLAGKLIPSSFGIPISVDAANQALENLIEKIQQHTSERYTRSELINALTSIANEKMAEAIRKISLGKGHDPKEYSLVSFGGAGGQHAAGIAEILGIKKIVIPYEAGLLSAYGIGTADIEAFEEKLILKVWPVNNILSEWEGLELKAVQRLESSGFEREALYIKSRYYYLRFKGQENTIQIDPSMDNIIAAFKENYISLFGHWIENHTIELESIKLVASTKREDTGSNSTQHLKHVASPVMSQRVLIGQDYKELSVYQWEKLANGAEIRNPGVVISTNSTLFVPPAWRFVIDENNTAILTQNRGDERQKNESDLGKLELFTNRYLSVVEDMGTILQRTSFSVNVKERMDFSCALLDAEGYLIANAPHIPVHLGSMGICVRSVAKVLPMRQGDIIITNHPAYGGSHLPDVTLIAPVYFEDQLIGYVANRAHHAEIGGKTPGSMPANAISLSEEGVIIEPQYLVKEGVAKWREIEGVLTNAAHPTRSVSENLADFRGAVASLQNGIASVVKLCETHGTESVTTHFKLLNDYVAQCLKNSIGTYNGTYSAKEKLDDGSELSVKINFHEKITFDFSGSAT